MYHALGTGVFQFLDAVMTFEHVSFYYLFKCMIWTLYKIRIEVDQNPYEFEFDPQHHIEIASGVLEESVEVCERFRKKTTMYESIGRIVRRTNYDTYTEGK